MGLKLSRGVDVRIDQGEFVYVVGPSGAGKSSFIKLMYREEKPTHGVVLINGVNVKRVRDWKIPHVRRKIGVVFQDFKLLPHMTAFENVAFAMEADRGSQTQNQTESHRSLGAGWFGGPDACLAVATFRRGATTCGNRSRNCQ